jgi:stage II sporulation protein AA (anti-sigma F factor antagonist)
VTESPEERRRTPRPDSGPAFIVPGFAIDNEVLDDGTWVLTVSGELDLATGPVLGQRIRRPLFWRDVNRLVVELTDVTFVDSSGTNALVLSYAHAQALDRRVLFVCPDNNVLRRLSTYGLASRLPLYPSLQEALEA